MKRFALAAAAAALVTGICAPAHADPIKILFVGNSYTFGRVDPVMSYNAANVHDLTAAFEAADSAGTNSYEPHPWGGVPGIFKKMTDEAGLNYDVSISARNAATLRGQFLDTASTSWKLRENVASQDWGVVVLQEQSDAALPANRGKNANLAQFDAYAGQFEKFIHNTNFPATYTETQLYGSLAACMATGLSAGSCNTTRTIAKNTNADPNTKVYLTETWARTDMVFPHLNITTDPVTGVPIPDGTNTQATLYYNSLAGMTADLHTDFAAEAASDGKFAGVIPVGDAFQYAIDNGLVRSSGFYDQNGVFIPFDTGSLMDLMWNDGLHASLYGFYLDALVQFGEITGLNPLSLGGNEQAAAALGISVQNALILERVAAAALGDPLPEPETWALLAIGLATFALTAARRHRMALPTIGLQPA
jgi:hypothetical protein